MNILLEFDERENMLNINFMDEDYSDEHAEAIRIWGDEILDEFGQSDAFADLSLAQQENCGYWLTGFFDYSYSYCLAAPGQLNNDVIDELMLDVLPRKFSADKETFESFAPMMDKFLCWCEDKHYLHNTQGVRNRIQQLAARMVAASQNASNWGMAKSFAMGGGLDAFNLVQNISSHLSAAPVHTYQREQAKIGRNDDCPCGSSKKYKKCCLNN